MEAFFSTFFLVFFSELGDKTQLLALLLFARFRRPWAILSGIFLATLLNHAFAAYLGELATSYLSPEVMKWILSLVFFAFAIWILFPDKEEDLPTVGKYGAFFTTLVTFFLAEMGDKTQLATVALGAKYDHFLVVTMGSTLGLMASNGMVIGIGNKYLDRIPKKWIFRFSSLLFAIFGLWILYRY